MSETESIAAMVQRWRAQGKTVETVLQALREDGWMVAGHNDYRHGGVAYTFWLLTHPAGLFVQGEATTDFEALTICAVRAHEVFKPSP